jgi:hypothetical protein
VFAYATPDLLIAIGTAATVGPVSFNGCVVVGTKVFLHDCHPTTEPNEASQWHAGPFDQILTSDVTRDRFAKFIDIDTAALDRFLPAPLNPAKRPALIADYEAVALASINVTDYGEYDVMDAATIAAYQALSSTLPIGSLDTTLPLIRAARQAPFIYISGIVDRAGHFADDVKPREYAQNTAASHNAGVALAWMLARVDQVL